MPPTKTRFDSVNGSGNAKESHESGTKLRTCSDQRRISSGNASCRSIPQPSRHTGRPTATAIIDVRRGAAHGDRRRAIVGSRCATGRS